VHANVLPAMSSALAVPLMRAPHFALRAFEKREFMRLSVHGIIMMGARQKVALEPVGSSTETWHS
jgi:hypothetical protein